MAIYFTDIASIQAGGTNFGGEIGLRQIANPPNTQNNALTEQPDLVATYTWTGNEAANDVINICKLPAGTIVDPNGHVSSGLTAPSTVLTLSIGDNDLAPASLLPVVNPTAIQNAVGTSQTITAPVWVSGASYVPGNVVTDPNSTPANLTYTCVAATSGATAPHSAANTVWMPNNQRYANAIDCHAAGGNVAFTGGTQFYGGPPSYLPNSVLPNVASGMPAGGLSLNRPYQIQADCWLQALVATVSTANIAANAVSVFRLRLSLPN